MVQIPEASSRLDVAEKGAIAAPMNPATLPYDQFPYEDGEDELKSWREIAEEMQLPEATVYCTGMRALTKMRQAIGEDIRQTMEGGW